MIQNKYWGKYCHNLKNLTITSALKLALTTNITLKPTLTINIILGNGYTIFLFPFYTDIAYTIITIPKNLQNVVVINFIDECLPFIL